MERGSLLGKPFDYVGVTQNCDDSSIVITLSFIIFLCQQNVPECGPSGRSKQGRDIELQIISSEKISSSRILNS